MWVRATGLVHLHWSYQDVVYAEGQKTGKSMCGVQVRSSEYTTELHEVECRLCRNIHKQRRTMIRGLSRFRCIAWR